LFWEYTNEMSREQIIKAYKEKPSSN
jgi:hypothetical protein